MRLIDRLKELIQARAEAHAGLIFVEAKRLIVEFGCAHVEDAIKVTRDAWNLFAKNTDIPLVPEAVEVQLENALGDRIELGLRNFAAKFCVETPRGAAGAGELSDEAIAALVEDPTLPQLP